MQRCASGSESAYLMPDPVPKTEVFCTVQKNVSKDNKKVKDKVKEVTDSIE